MCVGMQKLLRDASYQVLLGGVELFFLILGKEGFCLAR